MQMSEDEIRRNYKQAKNKKEQIGILADLNACSREKIADIVGEKNKAGRKVDFSEPELEKIKAEAPKQKKSRAKEDKILVELKKRLGEANRVFEESSEIIRTESLKLEKAKRDYQFIKEAITLVEEITGQEGTK